MPTQGLWATMRHYALELLPPLVSRLISRILNRLRPPPPDPVTAISTPAELDEWAARAEAAAATSDDGLRSILGSFRYQITTEMPADPFSPEYAAAQWEVYKQISGRSHYAAAKDEQPLVDIESAVRRPFPYATESGQTLGDQLVMQGLLIRHMGLRPQSQVLEFGPGWGNLTLHLALTGHHVTAVDIAPEFVEIIRRRAQQLGLEITLACGEMLTYESGKAYDAVVFFESFHHCADHMAMLRRLHSLVKDDGIVVFGFEPILPVMEPWGDCGWGVRLDGMAVWSIRRFGWLELGFTDRYFMQALDRTGWQGEITHFDSVQNGTIVIARKKRA